ncbi:MAG: NifB/NifX family molybdenum-iron cluster-binding protein [Promethearchaeota archaeon]
MSIKQIVFPSALPGGLNASFDSRFGRCGAFTVIKQEDGKIVEVNVVNNEASQAMGGAGIQAAQIVGNLKPTDVVVGNLGPNASSALRNVNTRLHQLVSQPLTTIKEALDMFNAGKAKLITGSNVSSHFGMGGGGGRGMGGGGGRGMGGGGGRGRRSI